jgi:hypothetical protein
MHIILWQMPATMLPIHAKGWMHGCAFLSLGLGRLAVAYMHVL